MRTLILDLLAMVSGLGALVSLPVLAFLAVLPMVRFFSQPTLYLLLMVIVMGLSLLASIFQLEFLSKLNYDPTRVKHWKVLYNAILAGGWTIVMIILSLNEPDQFFFDYVDELIIIGCACCCVLSIDYLFRDKEPV